ncbi:MAG: hypothetical protein GF416_04785 [Candidatus Altiarchaeales archaeon]|nr:hypothetical protein [Candidatus Altiarchaeales archaeon]MBD3416436.1 hypothetical protein [Candidatus Altiarchaeales archaeon]
MESLSPMLVGFTGCLMVSFLFSEFFNKLRYPRVLGYILAGVFIGLPYVNAFLLPEGFMPLLEFLSEVGIVFFILLAGTEIDLERLREMSTASLAVGFSAFICPLTLTFTFLSLFGLGFSTSLIVALCMSVTAAAIAVEILMEYGLLQSRDGAVIVGAGMVDDILGVVALSLILVAVKVDDLTVDSLVAAAGKLAAEYLAFFLIAVVVGLWVYPYIASLVWRRRGENQMLTLSLIFGLLVTFLSQVFGLSSLIGAFIAGLIINQTVKKRREGREIIRNLDAITFGFIIPFFFISVGLRFDLANIFRNMPLLIGLTVLGAVGKYAGVYLAGKMVKLKEGTIRAVGYGMNSRGGIELIIAVVALKQGLMGESVFSLIVSVALLTTFTSLHFFKRQVAENMNRLGPLVDDTLKEGVHPHRHLAEM